jgi:hypothetical protein
VRISRPYVAAVIATYAVALPVTALGAADPIKGHTYRNGATYLHVSNTGKVFRLGYVYSRCSSMPNLVVEGGSIKNGKLAYDGRAHDVSGASAGHITVRGKFKSASKVVVRYTHEEGNCHVTDRVTLQ